MVPMGYLNKAPIYIAISPSSSLYYLPVRLLAVKVKGRYVPVVGEIKEGVLVGKDRMGRPVKVKVKGGMDFGPVKGDSVPELPEIDLKELWELGEEVSLEEACELIFGEVSPVLKASVFFSALGSPYFKVEGERLVPRSEEDVRSILRREEAAREEEALREEIRRILKGEPLPLVDVLRAMYRGEREDRRIGRIIAEDENFWRKFLNAGHIGPEDVSESVRSLMVANTGGYSGERFKYEDLRHLPTFSIDDAETEDIDDAISVIPEGDGYEVYIHIALPYAVVGRGTEADLLAKERGATLYLPDGKWHMYPEEAVGDMSLREGMDRPSLTLRIRMDLSGEITDYSFHVALIRNRLKLNYGNAHLVLRREGIWEDLMHIRSVLRERRLKAGGLAYDHPFLKVKYEDGRISVSLLKPNDATSLVGELMILYNSLAGRWLAERGMVGIFRIQEEPPPNGRPSPSDPLYFLRLRSLGRPVKTSIKPGPHRGLGVPYYVRATSPIRRYSDVLNQHQLLATLKFLPPLTPEVMERDMAVALAGELKRHKAQNERRTHILLHYLKAKGQIEGVVSGKGKVFLPELLMEVKGRGLPKVGTRATFRVAKVMLGDGTALLEPVRR